MPAIVDAHTHLAGNARALVDQLQRLAYYGIAATLSLGQDTGDVPSRCAPRRSPMPRGSARPAAASRCPSRPHRYPYWVTTEAEARKAVQELASQKVDIVKIWVDDRNGMYKKLTPALYGADHRRGAQAQLRVVAHIFTLEDAKGLLRAGIDGFAHGVRDKDIDDEFVTMFKQRPNVFLIPNLPDRGIAGSLAG